MLIYVCLKQASRLSKKVTPCPFALENEPHTLRELIVEAVRACVRDYRARAARGADPPPLTDEQLDQMREFGVFAFGGHYNQTEIDDAAATESVFDATRDGLVRIFRGTEELTALDAALKIREGDVFTFVRLTMLSGRMW